MITGDNSETAFAIAKECGIIEANIPKNRMHEMVITGPQFASLAGGVREVFTDLELSKGVNKYSISEIDDQLLETARQEGLRQQKLGTRLNKK